MLSILKTLDRPQAMHHCFSNLAFVAALLLSLNLLAKLPGSFYRCPHLIASRNGRQNSAKKNCFSYIKLRNSATICGPATAMCQVLARNTC